ncbi:MAG: radical SAM protein [Candidatus Pacebacteria bacterium]|nr:radical SAM protein [Candidatus Paceibacterota bacterium]
MKNPYFIYEITPRCNSNCLYCYNIWKENSSYPHGELRIVQIKELFTKLFSEVIPKRITIAGGEPLMYSDLFEVISFLRSQNIMVSIATNGTLLSEGILKKLIASGVDYFEISLVSLNSKTYERLSRNNKLPQAKKAILNIKKYKARLAVSFVINKLNFENIEDVIDFCYASSVDVLALNRFALGGRGLKYKSLLQISNFELKTVLKIANQKSKEYNFPINITIPIENCLINHNEYPFLNFGGCECGRRKWVIDPLGNLRICEQNPHILGSLFKKSFYELSGLDKIHEFKKDNLRDSCNSCKLFDFCRGGCRYTRYN